jgi:hypothetical protein
MGKKILLKTCHHRTTTNNISRVTCFPKIHTHLNISLWAQANTIQLTFIRAQQIFLWTFSQAKTSEARQFSPSEFNDWQKKIQNATNEHNTINYPPDKCQDGTFNYLQWPLPSTSIPFHYLGPINHPIIQFYIVWATYVKHIYTNTWISLSSKDFVFFLVA